MESIWESEAAMQGVGEALPRETLLSKLKLRDHRTREYCGICQGRARRPGQCGSETIFPLREGRAAMLRV